MVCVCCDIDHGISLDYYRDELDFSHAFRIAHEAPCSKCESRG